MERSRKARFSADAPAGSELKLAAALVGVALVAGVPVVVQGLVAWLATGIAAFPEGQLFAAYGGLMRGQFGVGLREGVAAELPSDGVLWMITIVVELVAITCSVLVIRRALDAKGTGSRYGLATPSQAAEALGMSRLRQSAAVVRPDLYAPSARFSLPAGQHGAQGRRPRKEQGR